MEWLYGTFVGAMGRSVSEYWSSSYPEVMGAIRGWQRHQTELLEVQIALQDQSFKAHRHMTAWMVSSWSKGAVTGADILPLDSDKEEEEKGKLDNTALEQLRASERAKIAEKNRLRAERGEEPIMIRGLKQKI